MNISGLPFTMLPWNAVLDSQRKVFAHYHRSFPLSIDNRDPAQDYYANQFLNPHGENDKYLAQGGFLRARPLPAFAPNQDPDWRVINMEQEIALALERGINGFTFNIFNPADAEPGGYLPNMLQAAANVDPRFKIMLMPDMVSLQASTYAVADVVRAVHVHPSIYRHNDGRLVLSPFYAERVVPSDWASMLATLGEEGISIVFLPCFLSLPQSVVDVYAGISIGLGNFGGTGHSAQDEAVTANAARVRASEAPIFFPGITPQGYRPKVFKYWEAYNSAAYRDAWSSVIYVNADLVQLSTWNDFSESTHVAPGVSATGDSGSGFYDLTGYCASWYHTNTPPQITNDALYYFYRKEPTDSVAPNQHLPVTLQPPGEAQNKIEVLAFLTAPGTVTVSTGGKGYGKPFPAGVHSFAVSAGAGTPIIKLKRLGAEVFRVTGNPPIYSADQGLPSGVLDLTYWSGGTVLPKGEHVT